MVYGARDAAPVLADLAPELPAEFRTLDQSYGASLAERLFGVSRIGTLCAGHGCDLLTLAGGAQTGVRSVSTER